MASPTPNDLTRQQLDELDSLLQRMLALPLSQPEPAVAFSPPPPLPELPPPAPRPAPRSAPEPAFAPSFLPFPAPTREERPLAPHHYPDPSPAVEFVPVVASGTLRGVDAPALPFNFHRADPAPLPPPSVVDLPDVNPFADAPVPLPPPAPPTRIGRPVPIALWPVFGVNWLMEFALGWFGPVGHLLTRPAMKTTLGWAGVLLVVGAGVWAARGMGWVPWPR